MATIKTNQSNPTKPGLYLWYDGADVKLIKVYKIPADMIKNLSGKYKKFYLCTNIVSMGGWKEVSNFGGVFSKPLEFASGGLREIGLVSKMETHIG